MFIYRMVEAEGYLIFDVSDMSDIKKIGTGGKSRGGGDDKQAIFLNGLRQYCTNYHQHGLGTVGEHCRRFYTGINWG
jgi:hypothetical protein